MKTILKITALIAVTALAMLSCSPDASLSGRDWSEWDSARNPAYTNYENADYTLSIEKVGGTQGGSLKLPNTGVIISEGDRELVLRFPADADFLKVPNDQILARMKEFLSIYTFTNPDPIAPETYFFSKEKTDVDYEFVRRNNLFENNKYVVDITIRLTSLSALPADQSILSSGEKVGMVIKTNAAKYTIKGFGLDRDHDGNYGEEIYDDDFQQISVSGSGGYVPPGGPRLLTLTIGEIDQSAEVGFTSADASRYISVAKISNVGGIGATPLPGNARRKVIMEALIGKFKIQKFNDANGLWEDFAATISYHNDDVNPGVNGTYGDLVTNFTPTDLGIYRIYATGLKDLKTEGQAGFYGAELKIGIKGSFPGSNNNLRADTYISNNIGFFNSDSHQFVDDSDNVYGGNLLFNYDNAQKKSSVKFLFNEINYSAGVGGTAFLKEDEATFKKYVRFAYRTSGGQLGTYLDADGQPADYNGDSIVDDDDYISLSDVSDIAFLKFSKVEFAKHPTTGTQDATWVTVTIDEGFKFGSQPNVYILIANNNELYSHSSLQFGDFTKIDTVIDGVRGWTIYEKIE